VRSSDKPLRRQLLEECLRLLQVTRVEALREPPVHRSQQFARLVYLSTPERLWQSPAGSSCETRLRNKSWKAIVVHAPMLAVLFKKATPELGFEYVVVKP
jgi:hypothetical protein